MTKDNNEDLHKDYDQAGFGGDIGFGKRPALVLVDFMMAYFDEDAPLYAGVEAEVNQAKKLLHAAREAGIPVFHTKVEYTNDKQAAIFRKKVAALNGLVPGGPLSVFHEAVTPIEGEPVLIKHYASAFFGTDLAERLRAKNCDSLFICGLTTSGCIRATGLDSLQNEFIPVIAEDACGDRDPRVHQSNIFDLGAKYAAISSVDELISYLKK